MTTSSSGSSDILTESSDLTTPNSSSISIEHPEEIQIQTNDIVPYQKTVKLFFKNQFQDKVSRAAKNGKSYCKWFPYSKILNNGLHVKEVQYLTQKYFIDNKKYYQVRICQNTVNKRLGVLISWSKKDIRDTEITKDRFLQKLKLFETSIFQDRDILQTEDILRKFLRDNFNTGLKRHNNVYKSGIPSHITWQFNLPIIEMKRKYIGRELRVVFLKMRKYLFSHEKCFDLRIVKVAETDGVLHYKAKLSFNKFHYERIYQSKDIMVKKLSEMIERGVY